MRGGVGRRLGDVDPAHFNSPGWAQFTADCFPPASPKIDGRAPRRLPGLNYCNP